MNQFSPKHINFRNFLSNVWVLERGLAHSGNWICNVHQWISLWIWMASIKRVSSVRRLRHVLMARWSYKTDSEPFELLISQIGSQVNNLLFIKFYLCAQIPIPARSPCSLLTPGRISHSLSLFFFWQTPPSWKIKK